MNRFFVLILVLLFFTNGVTGQTEESAALETLTGKINGTLLIPSSSGKMPVVLLIAGSGPTDRNGNNPMMVNNSLKLLAEGLCAKGIATLRYDKRGIGESRNAGLKEQDLRFENYVEDAAAWVSRLKNDARFSEVDILGHSEGSLIGMIAAQEGKVTKFISLAGVGSRAGDILREQLKSQPAGVLEQSLPILQELEDGRTVDNVPQMLYALFRPSVQPYMISWLKYDPCEEIAKLKIPVLIVQGSTDIQVPVEEAGKLAAANLRSKKVIVEGMNHVLKEAPADRQENVKTYVNASLPLKQGLVDTIAGFVLD